MSLTPDRRDRGGPAPGSWRGMFRVIGDLVGALPGTLGYCRYASLRRWSAVIVALVALNVLGFVAWDAAVRQHQVEEMFGFPCADLALSLLVLTAGFAGIAPAIHAVQVRYGARCAIAPYRGTWVFTKPRRWYWGVWAVTDEAGGRHAVLTLGADVKEAVNISQ
jgi:hypothetical protein